MSNSEIDIIKTTVDKISVKLSKVSSIIQTHEITLAGVKKFEETFWKRYDDLKKKTEESEKLARYAAEGFREYTSAFNNMKSSFNILEENQEEFKTDFIKFKKDITFVINEI